MYEVSQMKLRQIFIPHTSYLIHNTSMNFIILSSSKGTTLQAILDAQKEGSLTATCLGVVADREDRGCVQRAKDAGIATVVVEKHKNESGDAYDERLDSAIRSLGDVDIIAAIGWMFVLSPRFIQQWSGRILNVHPALLPTYGGRGMFGSRVHQAVIDAGEKESGMTIHLMDEGVDTGKIVLQKTCPVMPDDTVETLKMRVQELEKEWYPKVLQMVEEGEIRL
jgi:phosphoribosylglycinamide formyltransferase 1